MSKMQKYTLMGLMLLILCLVTWALATGLGILQGNAAAAAAQLPEEAGEAGCDRGGDDPPGAGAGAPTGADPNWPGG